MIRTRKKFSMRYFNNNTVFTLIIWLTISFRQILTKDLLEIINRAQNVTNLANNLGLIENEDTNTTKYYHQGFPLTKLVGDYNHRNVSKSKNGRRGKSFQHPSGFMLSDYNSNNDYAEQNHMTPKFMSSSISSPPMTSSEHVQPINYHRYNPHDNIPSDDNEYESYSAPDDYYHHHHHNHQHPPHHYEYVNHPPMMMMPPSKSISNFLSTDTLKILMIVLLKLVLFKLSAIGLIKLTLLFLLKLPFLIFGFIFKILFFVKLTNILKILSLPIFLPFILLILAPLLIPLLAPLLLLPLLLPLLLFLPIPILTITTSTTTTTTTVAPGRKRRRRRYLDGVGVNHRYNSDRRTKERGDMEFFRLLIESEMCLERIACKLAADKNATPFSGYISRILETIKYYLFNPRLDSYVRAYRFGASKGSTFASCVKYYPCTKYKP